MGDLLGDLCMCARDVSTKGGVAPVTIALDVPGRRNREIRVLATATPGTECIRTADDRSSVVILKEYSTLPLGTVRPGAPRIALTG